MNRNKRNRYKSLILAIIKQEQLILAQGEDSKKGSFQANLHKMIRFLSEILKKHMKLAKIIKISEIFNRLVFPLNFNRFCHPMTVPYSWLPRVPLCQLKLCWDFGSEITKSTSQLVHIMHQSILFTCPYYALVPIMHLYSWSSTGKH